MNGLHILIASVLTLTLLFIARYVPGARGLAKRILKRKEQDRESETKMRLRAHQRYTDHHTTEAQHHLRNADGMAKRAEASASALEQETARLEGISDGDAYADDFNLRNGVKPKSGGGSNSGNVQG